jgi:hypothetical protein
MFANRIPSLTRYTDPNHIPIGMSYAPEGHTTGNEWFADYVAALAMHGSGLPAGANIGDWETRPDPSRGMKAAKQSIAYGQSPGRNINKSAARFRQKNAWMLKSARELYAMLGNKDMTVDEVGIPPEIANQLGGPQTSVRDLLDEFIRVPDGRLENMNNPDRHKALNLIYKSLK